MNKITLLAALAACTAAFSANAQTLKMAPQVVGVTTYEANTAVNLVVVKPEIQLVNPDPSVFTVVQPVTVPSKPSNSRAKTLVIWTFFGFILGCGIVFLKGYWPKLKEMFAADEQKPADEQPKQ